MPQALLALLAVLVAAAVAIHWQRLKHEADLVREDFRKVVSAGANFHVAVGRCMGFLLIEERQDGRLWDYQRKEFQSATDDADRTLVRLGAAITLFNSSTPSLSATALEFFRAAGGCDSLLDRIDGWAPHPNAPPEQNARITIIRVVPEGDLRHRELAAALRVQLGAFSTTVDSLSEAVARRSTRLLRWVSGLAYATYGLLLAAFIATGVFMVLPRRNWTAQVQDDRIIWIDASSRSYFVVPLPPRPAAPSAKPTPLGGDARVPPGAGR